MGKDDSITTLEAEKLDLERQRLQIERDKLDRQDSIEANKIISQEKIEQKKQKEERYKTIGTGASILVPLVVLIVTIFYGQKSERRKADTDFEVKAAEIVMNSSNPFEAKAKAGALKALFSDRLPEDFAKFFEANSFGMEPDPNYQTKLELLKMINQYPKDRAQIVDRWVILFPGTKEWAEQMK